MLSGKNRYCAIVVFLFLAGCGKIIGVNDWEISDTDTTEDSVSQTVLLNADSGGDSDSKTDADTTVAAPFDTSTYQETTDGSDSSFDTNFDTVLDTSTNIDTNVSGPIVEPIDDEDSDGVENANDNCPFAYNPRQVDFDTDNNGVVCDSMIRLPASVTLFNAYDTDEDMEDYYRDLNVYASQNVSALMGGTAPFPFSGSSVFDQSLMTFQSDESVFTWHDNDTSGDTEDYLSKIYLGADAAVWVAWDESTTMYHNGTMNAIYPSEASIYRLKNGSILVNTRTDLELWTQQSVTHLLAAKEYIYVTTSGNDYLVLVTSIDGETIYTLKQDGTFTQAVGYYDDVATRSVSGDESGAQWYCAWDAAASKVSLLRFKDGKLQSEKKMNSELGCTELFIVSVREAKGSSNVDSDDQVWVAVDDNSLYRCNKVTLFCYLAGMIPVAPKEIYAAGMERYVRLSNNEWYWLGENHNNLTLLSNLDVAPVNVAISQQGNIGFLWVEENSGTTANPASVTAWHLHREQSVSTSIDVAIDYEFDLYGWEKGTQDGTLWHQIGQGAEGGAPYGFYSCSLKDEQYTCIAHQQETKKGANVLSDNAGNTLVGAANHIYAVINGELKMLRYTSNYMTTLSEPKIAADEGYYWVQFEQTDGQYALGRWKDGVLEDVMANQPNAATVFRDKVDALPYVIYQNSFGWNLAHLDGGEVTNLLSSLSEKPTQIPNSTGYGWISYALGDSIHMVELSKGKIGESILWSNGKIDSASYVAIRVTLADGQLAYCPKTSGSITCVDISVPTGTISTIDTPHSYVDSGEMLVGLFKNETAVESVGYLWRTVKHKLPADCCSASTNAMCSSAAVTSYVCASNQACCDTAWSEDCVTLVAQSELGYCL